MADKKTTSRGGPRQGKDEPLFAFDSGGSDDKKVKDPGSVPQNASVSSSPSAEQASARGALHQGSATPTDLRHQSGRESGGTIRSEHVVASFDLVDSSVLAESAASLATLFAAVDPGSFNNAAPGAGPSPETAAFSSAASASTNIKASSQELHASAQQTAERSSQSAADALPQGADVSTGATPDKSADTPLLSVKPASGSEDTAIALDIVAALGDLDGSESLSITIAGVPAGAVLSAGTDNGDGTWTLTPAQLLGLTITPPANSDNDFTLTVTATATEANGGETAAITAEIPVTVTAVADAPNLSVGPASGSEDTAIALDIVAALGDLDGSESLSITISGVPAGALLSAGTDNGGGSWTLTPAQLTGLTLTPPANSDTDFTLTVTATATEGHGGDTAVASALIPVTVNAVADAPILSVNAAAGSEDTAIALDIVAALGDLDGSESLSITVSGVPAGALLSAGTDNGGGSWTLSQAQLTGLTLTPPANSDSDFTLTVTATATEANGGDTAIATALIPVTVAAVADAPSLSVNPAAGSEDTAIALDIVAALGDLDGSESLAITISGVPAGAVLSAGSDNGGGSWTLTPAQLTGLTLTPPANSDTDFTLTVTATATEANGGDTAIATALIPVTVTAVADAPSLSVSAASGSEDTAIALDIVAALGDLDGSESLAITISGVPAGAVLSAGTDNGGGSWTLTPAQLTGLTLTPPANSDADFTLTVTATATEGNGGDTAVASALIPVTVAAVADAPSLSVSAASGAEDTAIALDIVAALGDLDGSESLSITISGVPTGALLSAGTDNGNGSWTLTPAQLTGLTLTPPANSDTDFTLTVTATATEGNGGDTAIATALIPVTVNAVADAPSLSVNPASGSEDTGIALDIVAALGDLDGSESLAITISGVPAGALLSAGTDNGGGSWTLTPAQLTGLTLTPPANSDTDFTLTVTATATEGNGGDTAVATALIPVAIAAVADTPSLVINDFSAEPGIPFALPLTLNLVDVDGSESVTIIISGLPAGTVLSAGVPGPGGVWTLSQSDLAGLQVTIPSGTRGDFPLTITATATELDGGDSSSTSTSVDLTVDRKMTVTLSHAVLPDGSQDVSDSYVVGEAAGTTTTVTGAEMDIAGVAASAAVTVTQDAAGNADIRVDSAWGSVRNVRVEDDQPRNITISNFVDAEVILGNGGPSNVTVVDAKGGRIVTGDGADTIDVAALSDGVGGAASNTLEISTGAGNDSITIQAAANGLTLPAVDAGAGDDTVQITGSSADQVLGGDGNDFVSTDAGNDVIAGGAGNDTLIGGAGSDTIDGGADSDTASYATASAAVTVSLATTAAQNTGGAGTDTITNVENLTGSAFDDMLTGNTGANVLDGGAGDDMLEGGAGNDTLIGGAGTDTAAYTSATAAVTVSLAITAAQNTGGAGTDTLSGVENLTGSAFNDTLTGDAGSNVLDGGAGNDTLRGGAGMDILIGGAGNDTLDGQADADTASYASATAAVTVSLATTAAQNTGGAGADTITNVENLVGSAFNDTLTGSSGDNIIDGGAGNDTLIGGLGNDTLSGGLGTDTANYASATSAVTVNLALTTAQNTGGAGIDTLIGIENLVGSGRNDTLAGDGGNNVIDGGADNDTLEGGLGDDSLIGGSGTDTASYASAASAVTVNLVLTTAQNTGGAGTDTLTTIENLTGSSFGDTLTGNTGTNVIDGGAGDDVLDGGSGNDTLRGGAGLDVLIGGAGNDVLDGGADTDTASYSTATAAVTVSLATTAAQNTGGAGSDTITNIENLIGSAFNDTLTGSTGDNALEGGAGDDTLIGGLGNDMLSGGLGTDTANYASATSAVTVNLALTTAQNTGGAGIDTLTAIENLIGSGQNDTLTGDGGANRIDGGAGNDTLDGGAGNNTLIGGSGNDLIIGGAGNDTVDGGTNTDTLSYQAAAAAVTVSLAVTTAQNTVGAGIDTITNVENLTGSAFDDTLTGNTGANILDGGAGNDTLNGGAGNDTLIGGTGIDTATYASATAAVTVSLATTAAQNTGGAGTDTLNGIENLTGSAFNDTLTGSSGDNIIEGGAGNDTLTGGAGIDTASYASATAAVTVSLATTAAQNTGGAGTDRLRGFENLKGSAFNDTLTGNTGNNVLVGGAGADLLDGGAGNDTFDGGAGNDRGIGGSGNDNYLFTFGGGTDIFDGGSAWTDQISLSNMSGPPGGGDWTLTLTSGSIVSSGAGLISLTSDAAGTINLSDGSRLDFTGVETITF
jgi:Ca2+-binding RTX toxin-like protein